MSKHNVHISYTTVSRRALHLCTFSSHHFNLFAYMYQVNRRDDRRKKEGATKDHKLFKITGTQHYLLLENNNYWPKNYSFLKKLYFI